MIQGLIGVVFESILGFQRHPNRSGPNPNASNQLMHQVAQRDIDSYTRPRYQRKVLQTMILLGCRTYIDLQTWHVPSSRSRGLYVCLRASGLWARSRSLVLVSSGLSGATRVAKFATSSCSGNYAPWPTCLALGLVEKVESDGC